MARSISASRELIDRLNTINEREDSCNTGLEEDGSEGGSLFVATGQELSENQPDHSVQTTDQDLDETASTDSNGSSATICERATESEPKVVRDIEEIIHRLQLLPASFKERSLFGASGKWYGAVISYWNEERSVVRKGYLEQCGWKAIRGEIDLSIYPGDCFPSKPIKFVVARNCPADFLLGITDGKYIRDCMESRKTTSFQCKSGSQRRHSRGRTGNDRRDSIPSIHPMTTPAFIGTSDTRSGEQPQLRLAHPMQSLTLFVLGTSHITFGRPHSDPESQSPTSRPSTDTAAPAIDPSTTNTTSTTTRLMLLSRQLMTLAITPISVLQSLVRKLLKIPGLMFRCIWSVGKRVLLVAGLLCLLPYVTSKDFETEPISLRDLVWQALPAQLRYRKYERL